MDDGKRNYGIDMLRIVSMIMVVILHILGHGGVLTKSSGNAYWIFFLLETLCIIAVNCFALVSGYVNCNNRFSIKKLLDLWLQVFFINAIISITYIVAYKVEYSYKLVLDILFPISRNGYWYFTCYFLVYVFMPLLNVIINKTNKICLVLILLFTGIVVGIYALNRKMFTTFNFDNGFNVAWLCYLYLLGGVINKYDIGIRFFDRHKIFYIFSFFSVSMLSWFIAHYYKTGFTNNYTSIFNVINSVLILMLFKGLKVNNCHKFIRLLSGTSFAVYLIHDNNYIRAIAISNRFTFLTNFNVIVAILAIIGFALLIYLACSIVEWTRKQLFKLTRINKLTSIIDNKCSNIYRELATTSDGIDSERDSATHL